MPIVKSDTIDIHYRVTGSGTTIVLLHSFLCSGKMWRNQIEPLSRRWQVVNIDNRGHGASGPVRGPFSMYDMVDDVTAVLDVIGVQRAVWAGLSIGGMVALRAALAVPDRVCGLILVDTDAGPEIARVKLHYSLMKWFANHFGLKPLLPSISRKMFSRSARREKPELVSEWRDRFVDVDLESVLRTIECLMKRDDLSARLADVDFPSLVVVGRDDTALPLKLSQAIADALPDSELHVIDGVGHLSALENPEALSRLMTEFLSRTFGA